MSPCAVWDVTWKWIAEEKSLWLSFFTGYAKKWTFQQETGDDGYVHGQGRMSLTSKKEFNALKELMDGKGLGGYHLSPTSLATAKSGDLFYVTKEDTRTDGPWSDKDVPVEKFMTRQLKEFMEMEMYPWQRDLIAFLRTTDDRKILCIVQPSGAVGKSILAEYCEYVDLAYDLPPMNDMQDIMQCVNSLPKSALKAFIIDMPKAMKKDKLGPFFAGLECLKNGVSYDKRYAFKKRRFDRPHVILFTNTKPDTDMLSADRWDFRSIVDLELKDI